MGRLFRTVYLFYRQYKRFGRHGISFLLDSYFKKNQLITFSYPTYSQPITLRNSTSDIPIFNHVIFNQEYGLDYDFEPKIIIDCYANIGLAIVYFKNRFPNAKIISIEPEQSNFEMLLKNTQNYTDIQCLKNGICWPGEVGIYR